MLAKALDFEELEQYHDFVLAGGKPGKFKWQSPDRAGTQTLYSGDLRSKAVNPFERIVDLSNREDGELTPNQKGQVIAPVVSEPRPISDRIRMVQDVAQAQDRKVAYIHPDGSVHSNPHNLRDVRGPVIGDRDHIHDLVKEGYIPYALTKEDLDASS